jgi:hypothetical protein
VAATVEAAAAALTDLGVPVEQVELPWLAELDCAVLSATLFTAELQPYLHEITAGREAELHPVIARTLAAPDVPLAAYVAAERRVERLRADFARWFAATDVLVCPVVPIPAPAARPFELRRRRGEGPRSPRAACHGAVQPDRTAGGLAAVRGDGRGPAGRRPAGRSVVVGRQPARSSPRAWSRSAPCAAAPAAVAPRCRPPRSQRFDRALLDPRGQLPVIVEAGR